MKTNIIIWQFIEKQNKKYNRVNNTQIIVVINKQPTKSTKCSWIGTYWFLLDLFKSLNPSPFLFPGDICWLI